MIKVALPIYVKYARLQRERRATECMYMRPQSHTQSVAASNKDTAEAFAFAAVRGATRVAVQRTVQHYNDAKIE